LDQGASSSSGKPTVNKINLKGDFSAKEDLDNEVVHNEKLIEILKKEDGSEFVPITYTQAMSMENVAMWGPFIEAELQAMNKLNVWSIIPQCKSMKVIPLKWIFTIKSNGVKKACLVAKGCCDKEMYSPQDIASPTPGAATVRWFLVTAVHYEWNIHQFNVKCAFLSGDIDREKYVCIPEGINYDPKKFVCKLNRSIYGLAVAPMCWNRKFNLFMISVGFIRNLREPCVYHKNGENGSIILLLVYVDDILVTGNNDSKIQEFIQLLKAKFDIRDLGFPETFLGIEITKTKSGLFLSQSKYIKSLSEFINTSTSPYSEVITPIPPLVS